METSLTVFLCLEAVSKLHLLFAHHGKERNGDPSVATGQESEASQPATRRDFVLVYRV